MRGNVTNNTNGEKIDTMTTLRLFTTLQPHADIDMHARMCICMYICMYDVFMDIGIYACYYICIQVCIHRGIALMDDTM
jgi:hypothetical protein